MAEDTKPTYEQLEAKLERLVNDFTLYMEIERVARERRDREEAAAERYKDGRKVEYQDLTFSIVAPEQGEEIVEAVAVARFKDAAGASRFCITPLDRSMETHDEAALLATAAMLSARFNTEAVVYTNILHYGEDGNVKTIIPGWGGA